MPAVRNLPALTAMRGFAALAVFVYHLWLHALWLDDAPLVGIGYVGVAFFFVLSGFVLAWTYRPGQPVLSFWRRRFARVYPSHLVTLVVAAVLPVVAVTTAGWVALPNVLLVQSFWADDDVVYGMNGVAWSLACEAFFYALFPAVFLAARHRVARWVMPAVLLTGAAGWMIVDPGVRGFFFHFPPARLGEFALGVAVACEVRSGWRPKWVRMAWVVPALAATVGVVAVLAPVRALPNALLAVPFAGLILAAALGDLRGTTRVLGHRWLVYAGEVSFAFYLVHELALVNLQRHLTGTGFVDAVIVLLVACGAAVLLHHVVERPAQRLIAPGGARPTTDRDSALTAATP
jgi:peptidoglycan/LPS O-acetylase OafA/YrhL